MVDPGQGGFYSTICDWRASQYASLDGVVFGSKAEEFLKIVDLPRHVDPTLMLAVDIHPTDCEDMRLLSDHGWRVEPALHYAGNPWSYRDFVQKSKGELSVAKNGYVRSRSGWLSDRTACYLASGRPAIVQSTGLESHLPVGEGLLTFTSIDEAIDCIHQVESDYKFHAIKARELAEEHFNATRNLAQILNYVGL